MALIHKIKQSRPNNLIHNFIKYYSHLTPKNQIKNQPTLLLLSQNNHHFVTNSFNFQSIYKCPHEYFCSKVRFFAAPVQFKRKVEEVKPNRPRLNDEIKAHFLRLVTDEGHSVVPLNKALDLAKSLDLDLVEVDPEAKPPVCKIYDYTLAKYKKKIRIKERAKQKAAEGIKKGNPKEIRVSAKAETKDLKMKADTVKRLLESGYRVKCTAIGSEDEDLCGLLTKLSALIEDVAYVEFGPSMESKQPHMVVRHIKFAAGMKGVKKASKNKTATSPAIQGVTTDDVGEEYDEESDPDIDDEMEAPSCSATPVANIGQSFDKTYNVGHDEKGATSFHDEHVQFKRGMTASTEYASGFSPGVPILNNSNVRQESENRYARSAAKNTSAVRNPMRFGNHPQAPLTPHPQPQPHPPQPQPQPPQPQPQPQPQPHPRFSVSPHNEPQQNSHQGRQLPNSAGDFRSHPSGFGIFSNPNSGRPSDATRIPGSGSIPGNLNQSPPKPDAPQKSESVEKKFGIFSQ